MTIKIDTGFKPYPKQKDILRVAIRSKIKTITVCTGRQVGKSLIGSFCSTYWLFKGKGASIGYITPYYSQGKKVFNQLVKMYKKLEYLEEFIDINKSDLKITYKRVDTCGNTYINELQFFSAENHNSIRGNTFTHCIVDEAAFIKDEAWEESIKATTLVKCKKLLMLSTPKYKGWFYNEVNRTGMNRKTFTFSTWENPYIDKEELEESKRSLPENVYRQEILGEFVDNGGDVFDSIDVFSIPVAKKPSNRYFIGVDVAQKDDFTVVTVTDDQGQIVEIDRFNDMNYTSIIDRINTVCSRYPRSKVNIESNSIGAVVIDTLKSRSGKNYVVEGFLTTNKSKEEIISRLIKAIQDGTLKLTGSKFDKELIKELETFTFIYSPKTKKLIYGARPGFHDDMVMSLAIANNIRLTNKSNGTITIY